MCLWAKYNLPPLLSLLFLLTKLIKAVQNANKEEHQFREILIFDRTCRLQKKKLKKKSKIQLGITKHSHNENGMRPFKRKQAEQAFYQTISHYYLYISNRYKTVQHQVLNKVVTDPYNHNCPQDILQCSYRSYSQHILREISI